MSLGVRINFVTTCVSDYRTTDVNCRAMFRCTTFSHHYSYYPDHHECIKEWLLRHSNCPFCRHVVLPVDECTKQKLDRPRYKELCQQRARRLRRTYYCQEAGLVCLNHIELEKIFTEQEENGAVGVESRRKMLIRSVVRKAELSKLRGGRKEEACETGSQCCIQSPSVDVALPSGADEAVIDHTSDGPPAVTTYLNIATETCLDA